MSGAPFFAHTRVPQPGGTISPQVEQLDLLTARKPRIAPIDKAHVQQLPSLRRAINYSLSHADIEPKEAYGPLEMDKATWSRISTGQQSFPADRLLDLAVITGNHAPLEWLANSMGYELVPLKTELEKQLENERAARFEAERENELMRRLLTERR